MDTENAKELLIDLSANYDVELFLVTTEDIEDLLSLVETLTSERIFVADGTIHTKLFYENRELVWKVTPKVGDTIILYDRDMKGGYSRIQCIEFYTFLVSWAKTLRRFVQNLHEQTKV